MMHLIVDVETSGKGLFQSPASHPGQPFIVQLAAILYDEKRIQVASLDLTLIPPNDVKFEPEAVRVHGISEALARTNGVTALAALLALRELATRRCHIVSYNWDFDGLVIEANMQRQGGGWLPPRRREICAMLSMEPICKIPPTQAMKMSGRGNQFKRPSLMEAYRFCFKEEFDGAHDALADVKACARIYFWLLDQGKQLICRSCRMKQPIQPLSDSVSGKCPGCGSYQWFFG